MLPLQIIKEQMKTIDELKNVSEALEQTAASEMLEVRKHILASRQFFRETWRIYGVLRQIVPVGPDVKNKDIVLLITPNRGMCGSLISRVITVGETQFDKHKADMLITGKKGHSYFLNKEERTIHFFSVPNRATYEQIEPLKKVVSQYASVHIVFPRFINTTKQEVEVVSLVAKPTPEAEKQRELANLILPKRFRIEPDIMEVVNYFNQTVVGVLVYSFFSEALLAYSAAQMIAMRNAHENAKKEGEHLKFVYNKHRQALIDIKLRELHKVRMLLKKSK